jgi:ABC-type transporter Mla MlaB component
MPWILEPGVDRLHLVCSEHLDIYEATRLQRLLVDLASEPRPIEIDLRRCVELDCAALQLLLAFRRTRAAGSLLTTVMFGSGPVLEQLRGLGVESALSAPC